LRPSNASSGGIASSLNVQLSAERLRRLAGEPDVSLDVYDRWLRGQSLNDKIRAGKLEPAPSLSSVTPSANIRLSRRATAASSK
jgi:hypothetical protein